MPPKFLQNCIDEGQPPIGHYFFETELEPAARRDTDAQLQAAQDKIADLVLGDDEEETLDETTLDQWLDRFEQSPQFLKNLDADQKENARSDIEIFADITFRFESVQPDKWNPQAVRAVFLEFMPAKISAKPDVFARMGHTIEQFFDFLDEKKLHPNAADLRREAQKLTPEMVKNAGDSKHWGISKGIAMQAMDAGVSMDSEADLAQFFAQYNANLGFGPPVQLRHAAPNLFKNFGRNDHVEVKYPDGSIKKDKFKRLEADLLAGRCELIGKV